MRGKQVGEEREVAVTSIDCTATAGIANDLESASLASCSKARACIEDTFWALSCISIWASLCIPSFCQHLARPCISNACKNWMNTICMLSLQINADSFEIKVISESYPCQGIMSSRRRSLQYHHGKMLKVQAFKTVCPRRRHVGHSSGHFQSEKRPRKGRVSDTKRFRWDKFSLKTLTSSNTSGWSIRLASRLSPADNTRGVAGETIDPKDQIYD